MVFHRAVRRGRLPEARALNLVYSFVWSRTGRLHAGEGIGIGQQQVLNDFASEALVVR